MLNHYADTHNDTKKTLHQYKYTQNDWKEKNKGTQNQYSVTQNEHRVKTKPQRAFKWKIRKTNPPCTDTQKDAKCSQRDVKPQRHTFTTRVFWSRGLAPVCVYVCVVYYTE